MMVLLVPTDHEHWDHNITLVTPRNSGPLSFITKSEKVSNTSTNSKEEHVIHSAHISGKNY